MEGTMKNKEMILELWTKFSSGNYADTRHLFDKNLKVTWPTSREYYENCDDFIAVNEVFGSGWSFTILSLEETITGKLISITYVTNPECNDKFYATSIFNFSNGLIAEMETYWAFQDKQPKWRKNLSKVYEHE